MAIKNFLKKRAPAFLALCLAFAAPSGCGKEGESGSPEKKREMTNHAVYDNVSLPESLWSAPEVIFDTENDRTDSGIKGSIKAVYYRCDYDGQESYAFAYLGIPEGAGDKMPAVLLLHGGGGTAYWQWVKEWVNRGYVALAPDLEGHVPKREGMSDSLPADLYEDSAYPAPHNQNYGDADLPIEQTWMYYAVSAAIAGNSLLHGSDYADIYKIGVCGVSWGGVIASIITGYDDRFAFSVPVYCSLNLAEAKGGVLNSYYRAHPAARVWDDDEGLSRVETPVFFLAMNDDPNAFPDSVSETAARCKNASMALVRDWQHSHAHAFARPEPYAFADTIVNGGEGMVKILSQPQGEEGSVKISVPEGLSVRAYIAFTGADMQRVPSWGHIRLTVQGDTAAYEITDEMKREAGGEVTYFYIWFIDNSDRVVSTRIVERI